MANKDLVTLRLEALLSADFAELPLEQLIEQVNAIRQHSTEAARRVDAHLVGDIRRARSALRQAEEIQSRLEQAIKQLTAMPWFLAVFVGLMETAGNGRAVVIHNGGRRVVGFTRDAGDPAAYQVGDEVFLSHELNVIMGRTPTAMCRCGETAAFERRTEDGRMVLKVRDEEIVVQPTPALHGCTDLRSGDSVRWDRNFLIAYEKIGRATADSYYLENTPSETFAGLGGLQPQIGQIERILTLHLDHGAAARKYKLRRAKSVMLVGPPGNGKTMIARALGNRMGALSPARKARFISIKPGQMNSMWHGKSEENYRELFRVAREAGRVQPNIPIVIFLDEVDSIGMSRGHSVNRIDDRVLTALMAELDGLEEMGNILVVAATNRLSALDAALARPGRLGDAIIEIPRPGMLAAREILEKHLPDDIPYAPLEGQAGEATSRDEMIETAVSKIFAQNGEAEIASVRFRDGKLRPVRRADMVSGAVLAKIAKDATQRACLREIDGGPCGIQVNDLLTAAEDEFDAAARTLTPANCRDVLSGLPQDVDVVAVEAISRKVKHPHRFQLLPPAA